MLEKANVFSQFLRKIQHNNGQLIGPWEISIQF